MIDREKIQSAHVFQSPFMRIHGLAQVVIRVANSDVALPDVSLHKAQEVLSKIRGQWMTEADKPSMYKQPTNK